MSQTVSPSTSRCYGLARVSRAWNVPRAGVYRYLERALPAGAQCWSLFSPDSRALPSSSGKASNS